jgi:hypothetical protein
VTTSKPTAPPKPTLASSPKPPAPKPTTPPVAQPKR